jgi:uracil phosphoribosyltransferase
MRLKTMKESLLTTLRDRSTSQTAFRRASDKLAELVAAEVAADVIQEEAIVQTPLASVKGCTYTQKVVLMPILRAGIALLPAFMRIFDRAQVGFFGIRRDEKTAIAQQYYENIPLISQEALVIVLDPMIATAGSSLLALQRLNERGVAPQQVLVAGFIAAPEGINGIKKSFPEVKIKVVAVDEKLNAQKFIVPGLGDFGDRYFGTT